MSKDEDIDLLLNLIGDKQRGLVGRVHALRKERNELLLRVAELERKLRTDCECKKR